MPNEQLNDNPVTDVQEHSAESEDIEQVVDETTESESESQDVEETPETESTEAESTEDDDDGFAEWAKEQGLPEGVKDPRQLAESYKAALAEMKRLQTEGGHKPDSLAPKDTPKETPAGSYFADSPVSKLVDQWESQGLFGGNTELKQQYAGLAKMFDTAFAPELKKAEMVMTTMGRQLMAIQDRLFGMEWNTISPGIRGKVQRGQVDELMQRHNFPSYDAAVKFYIQTQRPDLLSEIYNQGKSEGERDAQKKNKKFRWSSGRGNHGQGVERPSDWSQYLDTNGAVDQAKLNRLPPKQRSRVLDDIIRAGKKAGLTL